MAYSAKTDLTKKALAESLKHLMLVKPFKKISIREIVEGCGLNRQTFYYHFQDIYDLIEWIINEEILQIIAENDRFLNWQEAGVYLLRYIKNNEALSLCLLHSVGRDAIKRLVLKDAFDLSTRFVHVAGEGLDVDEQDYYYLSTYYSIAFASLLEEWMLHGMKRSPEELIHTLENIVGGTARQALERFAADKAHRQ